MGIANIIAKTDCFARTQRATTTHTSETIGSGARDMKRRRHKDARAQRTNPVFPLCVQRRETDEDDVLERQDVGKMRQGRKTDMTVADKKPVPIYEVVCHECKSKIQYKACEVSWQHITCPVCGVGFIYE